MHKQDWLSIHEYIFTLMYYNWTLPIFRNAN